MYGREKKGKEKEGRRGKDGGREEKMKGWRKGRRERRKELRKKDRRMRSDRKVRERLREKFNFSFHLVSGVCLWVYQTVIWSIQLF